MFNELIKELYGVVDNLANTEEGNKCVDDIGSLITRLYFNLVRSGISHDNAALICSNMGSKSK